MNKRIMGYAVVKEAPVMWQSLDGDNKCWVVRDPRGNNRLAMMAQGLPYLAPVGHLQERLDEYRRVVDATLEMLRLLHSEDER